MSSNGDGLCKEQYSTFFWCQGCQIERCTFQSSSEALIYTQYQQYNKHGTYFFLNHAVLAFYLETFLLHEDVILIFFKLRRSLFYFSSKTAFLTELLIWSLSFCILCLWSYCFKSHRKSHDKYLQVTLRKNSRPFENVNARKEIIIHIRFNVSETFFFPRFHVILFYFDMQRVLSLLKINE